MKTKYFTQPFFSFVPRSTGFYLVAFVFACSLSSYAQEIIWASKVDKYSSQVGTSSFSAKQILGKPNARPDSTGNGWQPHGTQREEFIVVEFDTIVKSKQILIVESMNTGYIRKVSAFDNQGMEYDVAHFPAKSGMKGPKLLKINVADFSINIKSVKVTLVPLRHVPTTVDAVGITASDEDFMLTKNMEIIAQVK